MSKKKPDPYLIDNENPEWTAQMFKEARPAREMLYKTLPKEVADRLLKKKAKMPVKAIRKPTKQQITIRLSREVIDHFKAQGRNWQTRINETLKELIQ